MVPQPEGASLLISGATILTMNNAFDVLEGDVLVAREIELEGEDDNSGDD